MIWTILFFGFLSQCGGIVKLIIDTDMVVDDVGALCAAHGLVELGEAEILSVGKEI